MGVVQEPVDGGGGQGFGHDRVEPGGVQVGRDGDRAAFVGGVDDPVEGFGGGLAGGQHADVVDHDQVGAGDLGDGAGDRAVTKITRADLIVITGDFVTDLFHRTPTDLTTNLSKLKAKDGVFAVMGNHDYWSNIKTIRQILASSGIIELKNKVHTLQRGPASLHIAGVDDYWENRARLHDVLAQLSPDGAAILLAHEPDFAVISAESGRFDLQLSGHTHGGQVVLPGIGPLVLPMYGRKYPLGLYQVGEMLLYTNRGLGTARPQIRFNCRPEIAMLTLHAPVV